MDCKPFGSGHINDTYLAAAADRQYILQRVNRKVFLIPKLVSNYELLVREVRSFETNAGFRITPEIFPTKNGVYHYIDAENYAWRLVEFIPGSVTYDISPSPDISRRAAKAIGMYQQFLNTLDPAAPCDTIRGFHNLGGRMDAYRESLKTEARDLMRTAAPEIDMVSRFEFILEEVNDTLPELPVRVTHNDTKLNNILFREEKNYVIDLDTVMRGYIMYDFGDMVRTFTSPAPEDEKDPGKTKFRKDHFDALAGGYLGVLKDELQQEEKETLLLGALYIIYEQTLRFLTDYLQGNIYYPVAYPDHNLVRTRTQIRLLEAIVGDRGALEAVIRKYL